MIYIGADKHGYTTIKTVEEFLKGNNLKYQNLGVSSDYEDISLQDLIPKVVENIRNNKSDRAILSCGTGIGVDIGANRFSGVRSCLATNPKIAEWSKVYDNSNCLCLVGWNSTKEEINQILKSWFSAEYDGSKKRLKMFEAFDKWH